MGSCKRWPGRPPCGPSLRVRRGPGMPTQSRSRRVCRLQCSRSRVHRIGALRAPAGATVTASEPTDRCRNASRRAWSRRPNIASRHSVALGLPRVAAHGPSRPRSIALSASTRIRRPVAFRDLALAEGARDREHPQTAHRWRLVARASGRGFPDTSALGSRPTSALRGRFVGRGTARRRARGSGYGRCDVWCRSSVCGSGAADSFLHHC